MSQQEIIELAKSAASTTKKLVEKGKVEIYTSAAVLTVVSAGILLSEVIEPDKRPCWYCS